MKKEVTIKTEVKTECGTIVTVSARQGGATLELEMLKYAQGYGTAEPDKHCEGNLTPSEAMEIRDAIDAWLGAHAGSVDGRSEGKAETPCARDRS